MPIASILIPVYNRENIVGETIKSALAQTVSDIEVVIVDNHSTDRTYEVCSSFAAKDTRIKLYRNSENIGPVLNWIRCAECATAPFSKLLFSDDLIHETYLERTLPYILSPDCALVYTPAMIGKEGWKGNVFYRCFQNDCKVVKDCFLKLAVQLEQQLTPVSPGAALFRTSDLRKNILTTLPNMDGYDFLRYGAGVDWLIYVNTAVSYSYISYVCDPLAFFRDHEGSITIRNEDDMIPKGYTLARQWLLSVLNGQ